MENRLTELELKFMEQEQTLETLSEAFYRQQKEILTLTRELEQLKDRLKSVAQSPVASLSEETPPPHY